MTCHDTEHLWNERLDARGDDPEGLASALDAHAEACPACAEAGVRYRRLQAAIEGLVPLVVAGGPGLVDRLRQVQESNRRSVLPIARSAWLSAAAALLVAGLIGLRAGTSVVRPPAQPAPSAPTRSLADALADATTATIDLARETSAPAGRVGRVVLASTTIGDGESPLMLRVPSVVPTADILRSVGGRVGAGVKPLSGSARGAFGFLLRSAPIEPGDPR